MIINENTLIKDLLSDLESQSSRIVFLVNKTNQLTGSVSQGDIIRALINGSSIKVPAKDIANLNPVKVYKNENKDAFISAKNLIIKKHLHAVPILDKNNKILSVITLIDLLNDKKEV